MSEYGEDGYDDRAYGFDEGYSAGFQDAYKDIESPATVDAAVERMKAWDSENGCWGAGFLEDDWKNLARAALGIEIPEDGR